VIAAILALGLIVPPCQMTQTVTYRVTSDQPTRPTIVYYERGGQELYDSLNWGNLDGDTMPWELTLSGVDTPRLRAQDRGVGQPWPTYTCDIISGGITIAHNTSTQTVDC
jgi:hypothetical protein